MTTQNFSTVFTSQLHRESPTSGAVEEKMFRLLMQGRLLITEARGNLPDQSSAVFSLNALQGIGILVFSNTVSGNTHRNYDLIIYVDSGNID